MRSHVLRACCMGACGTDMPVASGRESESHWESALYNAPLSNACPTHDQNSVGTCCIQCTARSGPAPPDGVRLDGRKRQVWCKPLGLWGCGGVWGREVW